MADPASTSQLSASQRDAMVRAAVAEIAEAEVGATIGGRYRVEEVLGAGTFGVVVRATDATTGGSVAIKLLRPAWRHGDAFLRFQREAKILGELRGTRFCRIHGAGQTEGGTPYIATEFLVGRTLGDELRAHGALSIAAAARILTQVCEGLGEAHARGVVHRDLKPENIFLVEGDAVAARGGDPAGSAGGEGARSPLGNDAKILDFGVAKALHDPKLTQTGQEIGTPYYMAPEQLAGERDVGAAVDLWAVGALLQELVTGTPAFPGPTIAVVFARILGGAREPLPAHLAAIAPILERCLARDPAARYASVAELAVALSRHEHGVPVATIDPLAATVPPRLAEGSQRPPAPPSAPIPVPPGSDEPVRIARSRLPLAALGLAAIAIAAITFVVFRNDDDPPARPIVASVTPPGRDASPPAVDARAAAVDARQPAVDALTTPVIKPDTKPDARSRPRGERGGGSVGGEAGATGTGLDGLVGSCDEVTCLSNPTRPCCTKFTAAGRVGTIWVDSEPSCQIFLDGKNTGRETPGRISTSAGKHTLMLVNRAAAVHDTFPIEVEAGKTTRVKKDYPSASDRTGGTTVPPAPH